MLYAVCKTLLVSQLGAIVPLGQERSDNVTCETSRDSLFRAIFGIGSAGRTLLHAMNMDLVDISDRKHLENVQSIQSATAEHCRYISELIERESGQDIS